MCFECELDDLIAKDRTERQLEKLTKPEQVLDFPIEKLKEVLLTHQKPCSILFAIRYTNQVLLDNFWLKEPIFVNSLLEKTSPTEWVSACKAMCGESSMPLLRKRLETSIQDIPLASKVLHACESMVVLEKVKRVSSKPFFWSVYDTKRGTGFFPIVYTYLVRD